VKPLAVTVCERERGGKEREKWLRYSEWCQTGSKMAPAPLPEPFVELKKKKMVSRKK